MIRNAIVPSSRSWGWRDTLAVLLLLTAVLTTARLGVWQQRRADAKRALLAAIATRATQPPLPELPAELGASAWRGARVRGVYRADLTVYLRNRSHGAATGDLMLTPLQLAGSGRWLMVERGWLPAAAGAAVPALPTPTGEVEVSGRLAPPPSSWLSLGAEDADARVRQNIDLTRFAAQHRIALLPYVLQQTSADVAGLKTDWPQPDLGIATNQGYAFQWWAMSGLGSLLLLLFVIKRLRRGAEDKS